MNLLKYFRVDSLEQIAEIKTAITPEMLAKIELWNAMLQGAAPWNKDAPSCGVLNEISAQLAFLVEREIGLEVKNQAIQKPMEQLNKNIDQIVEYLALLGGALVRPLYSNNKLQYEIIRLGNYLPLSYDFDGTLTGAAILKNIEDKGKKYALVEVHQFQNNTHHVKVRLYLNDNGTLKERRLDALEITAQLTPEYEWENVPGPMIIEFRNHAINKVDGTNFPVALISGSEPLIQEADEHWARMGWEQKGGELRVFADRDMFKRIRKKDGELVEEKLTGNLNKLIVKIEGDGSEDGSKIKEFAPQLRTEQQRIYLQEIFKRIEQSIALGRGRISDCTDIKQTATQYTGGRQEFYSIVDHIEDEVAEKYADTAVVFAYMAAAYKLGPNNPEILVTWNRDQNRKDITAAKAQALQEVLNGVMSKWEYRVKFYGEDEATAKANVPVIDLAPDPFNFGA